MIVTKQLLWQLLIAACITAFSCDTSSKASIYKRWEAVDVKGPRREIFIEDKKEKKKEMEFTREGKLLMYENGVIIMTLPCTIAEDKKSVLVSDPSSSDGLPIKILRLTSDELVVTSKMFNNDTLILQADINIRMH